MSDETSTLHDARVADLMATEAKLKSEIALCERRLKRRYWKSRGPGPKEVAWLEKNIAHLQRELAANRNTLAILEAHKRKLDNPGQPGRPSKLIVCNGAIISNPRAVPVPSWWLAHPDYDKPSNHPYRVEVSRDKAQMRLTDSSAPTSKPVIVPYSPADPSGSLHSAVMALVKGGVS